MVKITDPNETGKSSTNRYSTAATDTPNTKLSNSLIKEMLRPENKQDTTPINLRLETSIANQIEQYANEHNTTKTEVIKEVLTEHYSNKKITKGTFKLKEPVTLIIPNSKQLRTQYAENEINIISSVLMNPDNQTSINPLDPQTPLYDKGGFTLETITEANNILDTYDNERGYYHFTIGVGYRNEMSEEIGYLIENNFLPEEKLEVFPYMYHRGLLYINLKEEDTGYTALLIDVLCEGNEIIRAVIIDTGRALELARITNNHELIGFLHATDTYIKISEMVHYDVTNQELLEENRELIEELNYLRGKYDDLQMEHELVLNSLRVDFDNKQENEAIKYTESLEIQNKQLRAKLREYEEREFDNRKTLTELKELLTNLSTRI